MKHSTNSVIRKLRLHNDKYPEFQVVNLFQNGTLPVDALRSLPEELLTAVVQSVPLIVPSTEEDYVLTTRFGKEEKVGAPFKFNFAARDKLIEHIQRLRPVRILR